MMIPPHRSTGHLNHNANGNNDETETIGSMDNDDDIEGADTTDEVYTAGNADTTDDTDIASNTRNTDNPGNSDNLVMLMILGILIMRRTRTSTLCS